MYTCVYVVASLNIGTKWMKRNGRGDSTLRELLNFFLETSGWLCLDCNRLPLSMTNDSWLYACLCVSITGIIINGCKNVLFFRRNVSFLFCVFFFEFFYIISAVFVAIEREIFISFLDIALCSGV
jgi:hypothetical protein